jgi:isoleucyl-tRNA synthetase
VRDEALKALEAARNEKRIGGGLEAQIKLSAPESVYPVLERYRDELRYLFIVSSVILEKASSSNGDAGLKVEVSKAPGEKCERCWNYSIHVGEDKSYPTVCERCSAVLAEIEATAAAH